MNTKELNILIILLTVLIFGLHMDDLYCDSFSPGSIDDPVMPAPKPQDPNDHGGRHHYTKGANDQPQLPQSH